MCVPPNTQLTCGLPRQQNLEKRKTPQDAAGKEVSLTFPHGPEYHHQVCVLSRDEQVQNGHVTPIVIVTPIVMVTQGNSNPPICTMGRYAYRSVAVYWAGW